ncbi:MAG: chromosome segregation protein SMC [Candidatus Competibacteraceae bacterium]
MRLSKIKLAGFKSFVDPTALHLPSDLVGVVGPNGCGKSNIIDAVRWVLGESSARSLRGETMADVIFNGSANRKPVGQAAIELVFDNSQGRLGGPWASYSEIAIKRLVGRDGQSTYFLNGTRCRRRDIADIFLGTGLGSRSYAMIEQGMISRIIEAKPEELRVFLEEAAGISKYKERRRETENRIRHTRENLDRLNDLREELSRQLQHLRRQARAAEQYRDYRAEERRLRAELLTLRWRALQTDLQSHEQALRQQETVLEAVITAQRRLETQLEGGRVRRAELNDASNDAQGRYYQTGAEINRLEQYLQHQRELRQRRAEDERQVAAALGQLDTQLMQDRCQLQELETALVTAEPVLAQALVSETETGAALVAVETMLREAQVAWEAFSRRSSEAQRQVDVERTRIEHLEQQLLQGERRLERLRLEQAQLTDADLETELADLRQAEQATAKALQQDQEQLTRLDVDLVATRETQQQLRHTMQALQERVQTGRGRLVSLQTLQEAALGRHEEGMNNWLNAQGLAHAPRLAEQLTVEPGWEAAVEVALAGYLDAVCVPRLDVPVQAAAAWPQGLTLFEPPMDGDVAEIAAEHRLATKVGAPWPLAGLLAGVSTTVDLAEALARRPALRSGETLVTPQGVQLGPNWLRLARGGDEGLLLREREIRQLEESLCEDTVVLEQRTGQLEQIGRQLHDLEQQRRAVQQMVNQGHRDHACWQGQLYTAQARLEQLRARRAALTEERAELNAQFEQDQEQRQLALLRLEETLLALESLHTEQVEQVMYRERLHEEVRACRTQADSTRQDVARQVTAIESLRTQLAATRQALERLNVQQEQLLVRRERLDAERAADADAVLAEAQEQLAYWLENRLTSEAELHTARQALERQDAELRAWEQARTRSERQADTQRQQMEERRLALSEIRIRQQNLHEQLHELAVEPETLLSKLPVEAAEAEWLAQLAQVEQRIQRLGPINLAAIEEFAQVSERKQYLDAQDADLREALATLENAIHKIDRETRARFRETFERVNIGLQELFPRLFGGGQAHLELTGEEVLDAGVAIMAKPPGKRIGSISLLSGGEKALTAVALVFALFQLNPAPFCLLDEVDAPLDEANIGRFGTLVRDMSERVQFILITHNKATMEIVQHLIGVTMQEPGVSRLVAVDIEEAARLAAVR